MVLTEGQREERGRDVRVGLLKPTGGVGRTWRCVEGLKVLSDFEGSGHHRGRHRGPRRSGRTWAPENYWIYCHAHGRFERAKLLTVVIVDLKQDVHGFPYALGKMWDLWGSPSSRPRSTWPDVGRAQGALPVARVVFDPSTVREARDGQRSVKAQVQPSPGSARGTLEEGHLPVGYPWSLLRLPDPGRPSDYGEVASSGTRLRDTGQVPLHDRPLAQRGRPKITSL